MKLLQHILLPCKILIVCLLAAGVVYPCLFSAIAWLFFPVKSSGKIIQRTSDKVFIASALLNQNFTQKKYFRSSADTAIVDINVLLTQIDKVAEARNLSKTTIEKALARHTTKNLFYPYNTTNIVVLNLYLDGTTYGFFSTRP
jgi:K+-transporting ATPase c subunit